MKEIVFVFAVNRNGKFIKKHFGEADEYQFYKIVNNKFMFIEQEANLYKSIDEHGLKSKGEAIIQYLKSKNVNVIVSMQFGKNISMVNKYFIPIIISTYDTKEAITIIENKLHWIEDEINNNPNQYKLFTISDGILKSSIK